MAKKQQIRVGADMDLRAKMITFGRIAKAGLRNFFRNAWLTTAATAIMVVTLSVVAVGTILSMSLNETVDTITDEVALEVFLHDDADNAKQLALKKNLEADPNVENITFITKQDASEQFQEDNADNPALIKGLNLIEESLPASYRVELVDLTKIGSAIDVATSDQFNDVVEDINFDEERKASIDKIAGWQDFIILSSLVAAGVFATISILIIFNTIRMAIYTRSYEIEIMKLIGATPGYIRGPFLFEASLYGVIAGLITLGLLYSFVLSAVPRLGDFLDSERTTDLFVSYWPMVFTLIIGLGILIGYVSAIIAMSRYLRLKKW